MKGTKARYVREGEEGVFNCMLYLDDVNAMAARKKLVGL